MSAPLPELPAIRLACCTARTAAVFRAASWRSRGESVLPSLLFSYAYEKHWLPILPELTIRNFVLDSGAFTANSSGKPIDIQVFINTVQRYRDNGVLPVEIFSLDVIGDWRGTMQNTELLWQAGIEAIPTFHYGEPEDVLIGYAKDYPKIALGGAVGVPRKEKERWVRQCFARVWPKPMHGFGFGMWALEQFPFHTIDCSDWEGNAARFGNWFRYGGRNLGLGGKDLLDNLAVEAQVWLDAEVKAKQRWAQVFRGLGWTREGVYTQSQEAAS